MDAHHATTTRIFQPQPTVVGRVADIILIRFHMQNFSKNLQVSIYCYKRKVKINFKMFGLKYGLRLNRRHEVKLGLNFGLRPKFGLRL